MLKDTIKGIKSEVMLNAKLQKNEEHNGLEVVFFGNGDDSVPVKAVRDEIGGKGLGLHWNGKTKVWFIKDNEKNAEAIKEIKAYFGFKKVGSTVKGIPMDTDYVAKKNDYKAKKSAKTETKKAETKPAKAEKKSAKSDDTVKFGIKINKLMREIEVRSGNKFTLDALKNIKCLEFDEKHEVYFCEATDDNLDVIIKAMDKLTNNKASEIIMAQIAQKKAC